MGVPTKALQNIFVFLRIFWDFESARWRATNVLPTSEPEKQCVRI
jgi:hypothetical protein